MNLVVLGLVGPFLITLGLAAAPPPDRIALACIDNENATATIANKTMTATISNTVPCP
jgi:hypothetical protein